MRSYFKISNIMFSVEYPDNLDFPKNFALFEDPKVAIDEESQYRYRITLTDTPILEKDTPQGWETVAEREDIRVYKKGEYEMRLLAARGREGFYGRYTELPDNNISIELDKAYSDLLGLDTVFSSMFALEKRAYEEGDLVLHCAYMEHDGEAVLFSAPSGVGKSTQAGLWEKYRGSRVQNGDRALLVRGEVEWYACGWPVCGSSEICNNTKHPIRAIVTLSQEKENRVERLSPMQSFSKLYSEITVNSWDRSAQISSMDLLDELISRVPVYHLGCDISEEAVRVLEGVL